MTGEPIARVKGVSHRYGATVSLADVSIDIPSRIMVGVIGPDGVGKSTLLGLIAGVKKIQAGEVVVFEKSIADQATLREMRGRIAYMPQGLGRNLYPTLSVFENIDFFGRLFGLSATERRAKITELLTATSLEKFEARPAGKLSGPSHPRRADHRRRSPLTRSVLGSHQHDPRAPPPDERDGRHSLYGRGRAFRLADGDGRRQDHRHRHAEGAAH
jgi:ABC-type nitrate/sulfonate/bicarbonate transport system ATPase subunit